MEEIEVDPWIDNKVCAFETYRIHGSLFTIPFVVADDLTLTKSRTKFFDESRKIPRDYLKVFNDKISAPITLTPEIKIGNKCKVYFKGSSSQHMSTILEGVEKTDVSKHADILVASETLHKIANAVFKETLSWKLRAYHENIEGRQIIVLCDDDFEEIELFPLRSAQFFEKRRDSINFAQQLCERYEERSTNHYLHGSRIVISSLSYKDSTVRLAVVGEVDMAKEQEPVNAAVMTGRTQRVSLGADEDSIDDSFQYLWSRCFWLGVTTCLIGMRCSEDDPVTKVHRFDIKDYVQKHRGRIREYPDVATSCVAQVLNRLYEAVQSNPNVNWTIEYEGRKKDWEPGNIRISVASEKLSLWSVCEHYYLIKNHFKKRKREQALKKIEEARRKEKKPSIIIREVRLIPQKERKGLMKIRTRRNLTIREQFRRFIKHLST
ncbi:hypothetical protein CRE_02124 [Caenorhabditis remanei]|uniref:Uncharacterized protein n=2 Tax=Caenorhabditis remanei TaxID=31234 RepID=E3LF58_CAERE|nr:hypothetical protein CRE_02124 [Caenorhabditis remanei]